MDGMRKPVRALVPLAAVLGLGTAACLRGPALPTPVPTLPEGPVVEIKGFQFPADTTIKKGQAVVFKNLDSAVHNVAPQGTDAFAKTPDIKAGDSQAVVFKESGTYEYKCDYHSGMKGTVTVED